MMWCTVHWHFINLYVSCDTLAGETIPYTSKENEESEENKEATSVPPLDDLAAGTHYKLRGILVHSGQASGGHYYSFLHTK